MLRLLIISVPFLLGFTGNMFTRWNEVCTVINNLVDSDKVLF